MVSNESIYQSLESFIGSNGAHENNTISVKEYDILVTEALRPVNEIEKLVPSNITLTDVYKYATTAIKDFPNITSEQYITQDTENLNRLKYYIEGISITTVSTIGLLGR